MPLRRRACDRCHGQKLRCPRANNKDSRESCARCLNARVVCAYSAPLPTGRPATNSTPSSQSTTQADPAHANHTSEGSGPLDDAISWAPPNRSNLPQFAMDMDFNDGCSWNSSLLNLENPFNSDLGTADATQAAAMDSTYTSTLPTTDSTQSSTAPDPFNNSWADLQDSLWSSPLHAPFNPGSHVDTTLAGLSSQYLPTTPIATPPESTTAAQLFTEGTWAGGLPSLRPRTQIPDVTEVCIGQLSDLNVRLYPVYKASLSFAAAQTVHPGALLSNVCFKTVSAFLQCETTGETAAEGGCKALYEIFQASRSLLDIMHQSQPRNPTLSPPNSSNMHVHGGIDSDDSMSNRSARESSLSDDFSLSTQPPVSSISTNSTHTSENTSANMSPPSATAAGPSPFQKAGENPPDSVMIHLSLACYIRLLQIYHPLTVALRRDKSYCKNIGSGSPASFFELRLVLFVQLITHLLDLLRTAMAVHSSLLGGSPESITAAAEDDLDVRDVGLGDLFKLETGIKNELQLLQMDIQNG
uniref:Zn(2)-C6 fungal-type domain-containing protein n=1 Tax=Cladonia uncialis subsp. uncialis TaxID=180999 RepID=A0A1Z1C4Y1_CLAUC|nr:hypothetical protein [Cladonia uncialis subsp. uncialis]AUW30911.1 hypothetical protein [Cladonia uncialis subsp. uncialis]